MARHIQAITGKAIAVVLSVRLSLSREVDSPEQIFHPYYQFAQFQRFGDVIVCAHFQPNNTVNPIAASGNQNNPHR
ncbi:Putative uncharacterized protein [Escherichia coli D6-117.29]|nr:Putative uncharacterized protein [Escherichia coli D6-117.29]